MTNTPNDASWIATRLHRLTGLNQTQIDALSLTLDPVQVDQINDSDLASLVNGTLPGLPLNASGGLPLGLPGATSAARFVGGTASGAPTTGSFLVRDWVVTGTGAFFVCTVAGSPGTWVQVSGGGGASDASTSAKGVVQLAGDLGGTAGSPTVPGLAAKAPLASPALTGTPTAPTAAPGTNTTQVATTAFVAAQSGTFAPAIPATGSFTYDGNGNPLTDPDGNTYTWNADGTLHTQTKGGVTRTYSYNGDGTIASVA